MERKVGPLSAAQVESLVGLLKDKGVQARIAKARARFTNAVAQPTEAPDSLLGGALFFGHQGLQNGGMACGSCHRFRGEGGDLGPDLSRIGELTELDALASTIARASFPVMRAAYASHPITEQEAQHLAAFIKQAKAQRSAATGTHTTIVGFGVGLGAFALALVAILSRPKGVRARLIERATKR
jgi:mono/diheme cytochrome c family protein